MLLGLALYNGVMVDVQFPDVFYKKLLFEDGSDTGHKGTLRPVHGSELVELDDLKQLFPALHRGLTQLLLWDAERDGGRVEDVFCRNFEISYDIYGDIKTYPLVDGGAELPVTEDNRMEYSQRYVEHLLSTSVAKPFGAIRQGFWKVMAGTSTALLKRGGSAAMRNGSRPQVAVQLLRPEELRLMLTGLSTSEQRALYSAEAFAALRVNAGYVEYNGVTDRVIRWFWDIVLEEFTDEQRRKLLWFVTASDR